MEGFVNYVRNIFCLYILLTVVDNIITSEKYSRYIRLFSGILMIMVVLRPAITLFGMPKDKEFMFPDGEYYISEEVYSAIIKAEEGRNKEMLELYCQTVQTKVEEYASGWGYCAGEVSAELDLDPDSDYYGRVVLIRADLYADENGQLYDMDSVFYGYDIISIKNNLANFYNIPVSNIYINIQRDYKEGE